MCVLKAGDAKLSAPVLELPQDGAEVDTVSSSQQARVLNIRRKSHTGCWSSLGVKQGSMVANQGCSGLAGVRHAGLAGQGVCEWHQP